MASRKTHHSFAEAFARGENKRQNGKNAETGRKGTMYEVEATGNTVKLYYWGTPVVTMDKDNQTLTLRTNGFNTVTTKSLINAALESLGVTDRVCQTNHEWNLHRVGLWTIPFVDGMKVRISMDKNLIPYSLEGATNA